MNNNELIDKCYNNHNILYVPKNKHITISDLSIYDRVKLAPKSSVCSRIDDTYIFNKSACDLIDIEVNPFILGRASIIVTPLRSSSESSADADYSWFNSLNILNFLSDDDMELTGNNAADSSDSASC